MSDEVEASPFQFHLEPNQSSTFFLLDTMTLLEEEK